ncbi:MAG: enoyl-CoA hydratase [Sedimentisphaerales bacterium]|nr:enoyl-CoA hydratase [Sedimentisphaerales bacterium]
MKKYPDILYTKEDHIATITMNRPDKMNSFSPRMSESLYRAIEDSAADKKTRVIILTAKGRAFCAGADVKQMAQRFDEPNKPEKAVTQTDNRISLFAMMQKCNKPIIAAVNGIAVGGGLDLALACDIRIASDQARFAEVFVRRGLMPASGGTYFLPRLVGIDRALLIAWTGDMLDAREAEKIGLVTMAVPHAELEAVTMDIAEKLAKGPPLAIQRTKRAIYDGLTMDLEANLQMIAPFLKELNLTEDHREGARAFVEKREPVFRGE